MDLKDLFFLAKNKNILEKHNLPHTFFTEPVKILTEDTCLNQILIILASGNIIFPKNDSSDVCDMIENKDFGFSDLYKNINMNINEPIIKTPYIKPTNEPFINLICFMKAYASHTYTYRGSFKEYFKDVFQVFYDIKNYH